MVYGYGQLYREFLIFIFTQWVGSTAVGAIYTSTHRFAETGRKGRWVYLAWYGIFARIEKACRSDEFWCPLDVFLIPNIYHTSQISFPFSSCMSAICQLGLLFPDPNMHMPRHCIRLNRTIGVSNHPEKTVIILRNSSPPPPPLFQNLFNLNPPPRPCNQPRHPNIIIEPETEIPISRIRHAPQ